VPRWRAPVVERARADVAAGQLWKARDRLTGFLQQHPSDQDALELLGEVYIAMGDPPAAGRAWLLTERDDAEARAAIEAFEARFGSVAARIQVLKVRAPLEAWPPRVQERLRALEGEGKDEKIRWEIGERLDKYPVEPGSRLRDGAVIGGCFTLVALPWLVGLIIGGAWLLDRLL
jgi:hypothetical protein